jgi:hypothetical protein
MPCSSRIQTRISDAERLKKAIVAMGWQVTHATDLQIGSSNGLAFVRASVKDEFRTFGGAGLEAVSRKYAELGAREWGQKRGYSVTASTDRSITMIKR